MSVKIKILAVNDHWATIKYAHSPSRSRIKTDHLTRDYRKGILDIANEKMLDPYLAN